MIMCEGCETVAAENPAEVKTPAYQRTYPFCPGHPTPDGCHGYEAGCNCQSCAEHDRSQS